MKESEKKIEVLNIQKLKEKPKYSESDRIEEEEVESDEENSDHLNESVEKKLEDKMPPCDNCTKWFNSHQTIN